MAVTTRAAARRQEIVATAAHLFAERGYAATSFRDIAASVGLLKGSLCYYAPSKEELLVEIIAAVHDRGAAIVREAARGRPDTLAELSRLVEGAVTYVMDAPDENLVALREYRALSAERRRRMNPDRIAVWERLRTLIRAGRREGVVRDDVDDFVVATAIVGAINSVPTWLERRTPGRTRMIEGYRDFLVGGLRV
jgi:TetR/AcrR family transcriptional regulator, cholesterol catabolism regulator